MTRIHVAPEFAQRIELMRTIRRHADAGTVALVCDHDELVRRHTVASQAASRHGIILLAAVKASRLPQVLRLAADTGLGFDISNLSEYRTARAYKVSGLVSLTSPAIPFAEREPLYTHFRSGSIDRWHCDSLEQLEELCRSCPGSDVGIRVNLDGMDIPTEIPLFSPSRFGVRLNQLEECRRVAEELGCRLAWLHCHNGSEENTLAGFVHTAKVLVEAAAALDLPLTSLDLGGGLIAPKDEVGLEGFFAAIRQTVPSDVDVILEPGRFWMTDCMVLATPVLDVKLTPELALCVLDIGSMNHLQWSDHYALPTFAPPSTGIWKLCGRSCYEEDMLDEWEPVPTEPGAPIPAAGDYVVLGNISGYSVELRLAFNGIDPIPVEFVGTGCKRSSSPV